MLPSRLSLCALRGSKSWAGSTTPGLTGLLNLRPSFSATTLDSCPAATYSSNSKPDPKLEASEREVKLGANVPESIHHAASETVAAAGGLASSIATAVSSTVTASKRAIGLTDAKPLSKGDIHGGGGTMEYTPSWSTSGGPAADREHAQAKYEELGATEKPHFPEGEAAVNQMFPDAAEAAKLQSRTASKQEKAANTSSADAEMEGTLHNQGP